MKHWPRFNDIYFIEPKNHQFRTNSSIGAARYFLEEGWMVTAMVHRENFWNFRLGKMVNFGFFSICFTNLKLLILKLIFHLHNLIRICRMCKSLKATYTFSQKVKLTFLTANKSKKIVFLVGEVVTKIWLSILECKVGLV